VSTFLGLLGAAFIGSIAWLYQRAWERATLRIELYQEILDSLEGFFEGSHDAEKINYAIRISRKLWLEAPDEIVRAINDFFEAIKNSGDTHDKFAHMVLLMRKNSSVWDALIPRSQKSLLNTNDIKFHSATRNVVVAALAAETDEKET
jgi:hypothetical protein